MKKQIELISIFIIFMAVIITDVNMIKKTAKQINDKIYALELNYEQKKKDINKITLITFDDYMVNQVNLEIERKEREYQEYLASLIVYDGLTMSQLAEKLDRSLKNELNGYGYLYASYSLEKGVDPYMAVAISLHETGCNAKCSYLTRVCNNVGGQKGTPRCDGGSYKYYESLEAGIKGFIDNISNNYVQIGLNTPELMQKKYAQSTSWAGKVNYYIEKIRSN